MPRWTRESKERQREFIRAQKPWLYSTGARTEYGRLVCSQNARKDRRRCQFHDTGATLCQQSDMAQQEGDTDRPFEIGDRVTYIGQDLLVQTLLGGRILLLVRLGHTIACAAEDGSLILEFGPEELCNAPMDA